MRRWFYAPTIIIVLIGVLTASLLTTSPLTGVAASMLGTGENDPRNGLIDSAVGYAYSGMPTDPNSVVNLQANTAPSAPTNLAAIGQPASILLGWMAPTSNGGGSIQGYNIYRGVTSGSETCLKCPIGNVTSYTDSSAQACNTYYYEVSAYSNFGQSPLSKEALNSTAAKPSAPQNFQATSWLHKWVNLSWSPPASDGGCAITHYYVYRGNSSSEEALLQPQPLLGPANNSWTDYNPVRCAPEDKNYYKITALNNVAMSGFSNESSPTTYPSVPSSPQRPNVSPGTTGPVIGPLVATMFVSWNLPACYGGSPGKGYIVRRYDYVQWNYTRSFSAGGLSYNDTFNIKSGVFYFYRVAAINSFGEGDLSDLVKATGPSLSVPVFPVLPVILTMIAAIVARRVNFHHRERGRY